MILPLLESPSCCRSHKCGSSLCRCFHALSEGSPLLLTIWKAPGFCLYFLRGVVDQDLSELVCLWIRQVLEFLLDLLLGYCNLGKLARWVVDYC